MGNSYFQFRHFRIEQDRCAMKVCTDSCLFGAWIPVPDTTRSILDIGTGTGLLALILAQRTQANIDAVEIDPDAAEQAKENVQRSPWPDRINIKAGNIEQFEPQKTYDLLVCNPPFYENSLASADAGEKQAKHGLSLKQLFGATAELAHEQSLFALLLPAQRKDDVLKLAQQYHWHLHDDMLVSNRPGGDPFRYMVMLGKIPAAAVSHKTMAIYETGSNAYTSEFTERLSGLYCETAMYR